MQFKEERLDSLISHTHWMTLKKEKKTTLNMRWNLIPTPVEDDEGMVEIDEGMRERRQRFQSTAPTLEEPDLEMIPGSRRRSREQENILDDVPISIIEEEFQVLQRQNHGHLYPQKE